MFQGSRGFVLQDVGEVQKRREIDAYYPVNDAKTLLKLTIIQDVLFGVMSDRDKNPDHKTLLCAKIMIKEH